MSNLGFGGTHWNLISVSSESIFDGFAVAKIGRVLMRRYGSVVTTRGEVFGKLVYIFKSGKIVTEPQADRTFFLSEGLAGIEAKGRYDFIDKSDKIVFRLNLYSAEDFSGGLARVNLETDSYFIRHNREYYISSKLVISIVCSG